MSRNTNNIGRANIWRQQNPQCSGGVVVLFGGAVSGWMNTLRDPQGWEPGCIAIDDQGNQWRSTGGDAYNGAERWEPLN